MASKVRVYGKAQNRTVLGIVNAYKVMYPHATFEDFEKAFPKELNPDSGWPVNFMRLEECTTENEKDFWFIEPDEVLHLQDGTNMVVCKMWTKPSFERIVTHAVQYDIEVAEFEKTMKGEKGGFRLEYLNGYVPPVPTGKKKIPAWLWALLGLLVIGAIAAAFFLGNAGKKVETVEVEKTVEKQVIVHDTLYVQQLEEIEKNFNAAEFEVNKADLSDEAKFVLHDLGKLMQKNPDLRLSIEGHTSADGDAALNQKLSEARAQAAVDFLTKHEGVDSTRLEAKGYGSSRLKNADDPKASENRRTEFVVIE